MSAFDAASATHATIATDYLPGNAGWSGMDGSGGSLGWLLGAWSGSGYTLSLGVPIIPTNSSGAPSLRSNIAALVRNNRTTPSPTVPQPSKARPIDFKQSPGRHQERWPQMRSSAGDGNPFGQAGYFGVS